MTTTSFRQFGGLGLLSAVLCLACGGDQGQETPPSLAVADSAGVRIVQNLGTTPAGWTINPDPLLSVGWTEEGPAFQWTQSGRLLDDGGVLIGETPEGVIYRIDADGQVVDRWGRRGEGPGEYQRFDGVVLRADTVVVHDSRNMRVTRLLSDGEVIGTHPAIGISLLEASSMLPDGRLLFVPSESYGGRSNQSREWIFEARPILAMHLGSERVDTLIELPAMRMWHGDRAVAPGVATIRGRAGGTPDGFAWARADRPEVHWYDATGALLQIARWSEPPTPLTSEWRTQAAAILEDGLRARGVEEDRIEEGLAQQEEGFAQHEGPLPYWDEMRVDRQGNVWLQRHAPFPSNSSQWRVISRDGVDLGYVTIPDAVAVLDITDDRVLIARLDELDVNGVVALELIKSSAESNAPRVRHLPANPDSGGPDPG